MELKSKINKPYTVMERAVFVAEQNNNLGYEIRETETELQAWGFTEEELAERHQEWVNNLTMTALDFIGVLEHFGLDYATQIKPFLEAQPELDKQLKYCQNVWCGVAKQIFTEPITIGGVTITSEMVEQAFINKNESEVQNV